MNDYDLVVIGNTPEAILAASVAVHLKARVALVKQPSQSLLYSSEQVFNRRFTYVSHFLKQLPEFPFASQDLEQTIKSITQWGKEANKILAEQKSSVILSTLGIDVIEGCGEWVRQPKTAFVVGERKLRSQSYLLATGSHPVTPDIKGLEEVGYLTSMDLWCSDKLTFLPDNITIIAETPLGIELAQNLQRIGKKVTLLFSDDSILSQEDPDLVFLLQCYLEAEGITIYTQNPIIHARKIEGKKWLQIGNYGLETDEIILVPKHEGNLNGLNLESMGVKIEKGHLIVNENLQTTHPKIYACGALLGGYHFSHIAEHESVIAVKNALFSPWYREKIDYRFIPYVMFTDLPLARVGMTETQAKKRYPKEVTVIEQSFKTLPQSHISGETTGLCKVIVRKNGEILGSHILGQNAEELISTFALAIYKKIKIGELANLAYPFTTPSEVISQIALAWYNQNLQRNQFLKYWLETWLIWRRS